LALLILCPGGGGSSRNLKVLVLPQYGIGIIGDAIDGIAWCRTA
jgi:hypothetical protein